MTAPLRQHGGPDGRGAAVHDFSTNANACGPCPQALAAVRAADPTRYPDPASTALREQLAQWHAVAPGRIVVAASASEFIFRITGWARRAGAGAVALPPHAYGDYAHAARGWGLETRVRPAHAPLAWACEPSSPLGGQEVGVEEAVAAGATVVLDRAYEPLRLAGGCSVAGPVLDRLWQLWSPNKALGLTGLRAAYAIAPDAEAAAALDALAPSWPLGAHGVALLEAWCAPATQAWLAASREILRTWKEKQLALCRELGWDVAPGNANFMVAAAPDLVRALPALRDRGVQLRDCASFGLPGRVRLSVQSPAAQDALAAAWRAVGASA